MTRSLRPGRDGTGLRDLAVAIAIGLTVVACGGAPAGSPGAPSTGGLPATPSTARPGGTGATGPIATGGTISATISADETARVVATVGPQGGELETVGADGVVYRLVIPPDAVPSSVAISLAPIASIQSDAFGGQVLAGAVFEPSGLLLQSVAQLSISNLPQAGPVEAFAFDGPGRDLHRWVLLPGDGVVIPVLHFSGVGVATNTTGLAPSGDPLARAVAGSANALADARQSGDDDAWTELMVEALHEAFSEARSSQAQALADPLGSGTLLIQRLLALNRMLVLLGAQDNIAQEDLALIEKILAAMADELARRCQSRSHDPGRTFIRGLALRRQAELLGVWSQDLSFRLKGVEACTRYRPFADSTIHVLTTPHAFVEGNTGDEDVEGTYVTGRAELQLKGLSRWEGSFDLQVRSERWTDSCWTGRPFRLVGPDGPAKLQFVLEPTLAVIQRMAPDGSPLPPEDADVLTGLVRIDGYALVPVSDADECMDEDYLLSDIGGAFEGASGTTPFAVPAAGATIERSGSGRALLRPPGTTEVVESADAAVYDATYRITSDLEGPGVPGVFDYVAAAVGVSDRAGAVRG